jgi:hypothetical protein
MKPKKCHNCTQYLVPTSLGWICDNKACDAQYGLIVIPEPDNEHLHKAILRTHGIVEYRVHDLITHYERCQKVSESSIQALQATISEKTRQSNPLKKVLAQSFYGRLRACLRILFKRSI